MKEARGNMLHAECDALVITTNGFVKANGECVMGRGIAKQVASLFPMVPKQLGTLITQYGNRVHHLPRRGFDLNTPPRATQLISFPVKAISEIFDGTNAVGHMASRFKIGDVVPGWACKAREEIIIQSAHELVSHAGQFGWQEIACPRFGCGAGELEWEHIRKRVAPILDDRFTIYTF